MDIKKILIAVDGSPISLHASEAGIRLSDQLNAEVALVYVVDSALIIGTSESFIEPETLLKQFNIEGKQVLYEISEKMKRKPERFNMEGKPYEEILRKAQEWNADLIVMGTHGRTSLKRFLMGSVAENVLRHSKLPVLIIPSN